MVICAAVGCSSRSNFRTESERQRNVGISFFKFPKCEKLRKMWIKNVKRVDYVPNDNSRVCSKHFTAESFTTTKDFLASIGFSTSLRMGLREDAMPTIFDHARPIPAARASSKSIQEKRMKNQLKEDLKKYRLSQSTAATATPISGDSSICDNCDEPSYTAVLLPPTEQPCMLETRASVASLEWFASIAADKPRLVTHVGETAQTFSTQTQTPNNLISRRSTHCQVHPETRDFGTQTETQTRSKIALPAKPTTEASFNDSFRSTVTELDQRDEDPDWDPTDESDSEEEDMDCDDSAVGTQDHVDRKFIVYESCLDTLISKCSGCGSENLKEKTVVGTFVMVNLSCSSCESKVTWGSQPQSGTMPYGNLILAAGIMFSGASPIKVMNAIKFSQIQVFSRNTYYKIQSAYLVPAIQEVWNHSQVQLLTEIRLSDSEVRAGGDARCCSPGHTAKYASYSIMDLTRNKILDLKLLQSNEVKNSYAMELEGLKRCLAFLETHGVMLSDLVTDRHSQVKKYMKDEQPDINHWFDIWHVAKGVSKKIEAASKKKNCEVLHDWAKSVSNHMYWCAASSGGDGVLVKEKWQSILNHVTDVHEGHGQNFEKCEHGPLTERAWLKKGYKPYMELEKIVNGRLLKTDVKKLSPAEQTSGLESYHKVVCFFAPKFVHFQYAQMHARLQLSALHFNENASRPQALTKDGQAQYRISYPKARKGEGVATEVKVQQTFGYVTALMEAVLQQRVQNNSYKQARNAQSVSIIPQPIAASTPHRRPKAQIVAEKTSRFNTFNVTN